MTAGTLPAESVPSCFPSHTHPPPQTHCDSAPGHGAHTRRRTRAWKRCGHPSSSQMSSPKITRSLSLRSGGTEVWCSLSQRTGNAPGADPGDTSVCLTSPVEVMGRFRHEAQLGFLRGWVPDPGRFTQNTRLPRAVPFDGDMAVMATHSHTQIPAQTTLQNLPTAKQFL